MGEPAKRCWQIWYAKVYIQENDDYKWRPVILHHSEPKGGWCAMYVTSRRPKRDSPEVVTLEDWDVCGLRCQSYVKPFKRLIITGNLWGDYIGVVTTHDLIAIKHTLGNRLF